jgi:hypothetical protein
MTYSVVGDTTDAHYINNTLIPSGTLFTNYYAVSHPSLPNYLALTVGNTCGKDGTDTVTPLCTEPSIWTQMSAARITAREWAENESANCSHRRLDELRLESVTEPDRSSWHIVFGPDTHCC